MRALLILALILAGCAGETTEVAEPTPNPEPTETPTPWPEDYETWVCGALRELENATRASGEMGDAASLGDVDGVAQAAETAADSAAAALDMLDLVPGWAPGDAAVAQLREATTLLARGMNAIHEAASIGDADGIAGGGDLISDAAAAMSEGNEAVAQLRIETGFAC